MDGLEDVYTPFPSSFSVQLSFGKMKSCWREALDWGLGEMGCVGSELKKELDLFLCEFFSLGTSEWIVHRDAFHHAQTSSTFTFAFPHDLEQIRGFFTSKRNPFH